MSSSNNGLYQLLNQRLKRFVDSNDFKTLSQSKIGIEKECLREAKSGGISQKPHPEQLGSALTNQFITTDFSEALTEFITPPCDSIPEALTFLEDIQQFVYANLEDETLWATSMPCIVESENSIPIAQYGQSNSGKMKTVYREGLSNRYGKMMQVIAGVHFNYSLSDVFWKAYQQLENDSSDLKEFKSTQYMALVRNVLRFGWLIPYLFGASPAICKSFVDGAQADLKEFNENTLYEPFATSLRMGDIGYTNSKESVAGIKANYDSLDAYVESLRCAINTPFQPYIDMGVKVNGEYKQLNSNILQIENEYYSTVRPKQPLIGNEKPTTALADRGVEYVEIRSLDVNAFDPLGINEEQLYFLEVFVVFCLFHQSSELKKHEVDEIDANLLSVAHNGREIGLRLKRSGMEVALKDWASELFGEMRKVAEVLDRANSTSDHAMVSYTESLKQQLKRVENPENTVSAIMLNEMRENEEGFFHFAERMSGQHHKYFNNKQLSDERKKMFEQEVEDSLIKQKKIESEETLGFDDFLEDYFNNQ